MSEGRKHANVKWSSEKPIELVNPALYPDTMLDTIYPDMDAPLIGRGAEKQCDRIL